jgi:hypothetical protein
MISVMRRTITGRPAGRYMTLGDIRRFLKSIEGIADDTPVKAKVTVQRRLVSLTVEEEDIEFRDYIRSVGLDDELDSLDKE